MSEAADTPTYAEAVAELDGILDQLDGDRIDIDALGDAVARAAFLIETCRGRLDTARAGVEEIIAGLAGPDDPTETPPNGGSRESSDSPGDADD